MQTRLKDLRPDDQTLADADRMLEDLADVDCYVAVEEAKVEKRINTIKAKLEASLREHREKRDQIHAELAAFVENHRDQFKSPRKRKTNFGSYGLQRVTGLTIVSNDKAVEHITQLSAQAAMLGEDAFRYDDALAYTTKAIKKQIKKLFKEHNIEIKGTKISSGDTVVCDVRKALIEDKCQEALTQ